MHEAFIPDQKILRKELQVLLGELGIHSSEPLGADMTCLLSAPGKLLSSSILSSRIPQGFWALLPYTIARYCTPKAERRLVSRIGLACELLHSALDSFDEIEDDDASEERTMLGDGRFLNTATFLYTLVPLILDSLCPHYLSSEQLRSLQQLLTTELIAAMQGQHRDILAEQANLATFLPEECLRIVSAKSGVLFRLVCRISTHVVGVDDELVNCFSEVGELMGIVAQLENDVHGLERELLSQGELTQKSDLRRGKKTLPIVLAQKQFIGLWDIERDEQRDRAQIHMTAYDQAIKATLGAAAHLRERALALIPRIEQIRGDAMPSELRILLNLVTTY